ncbi:hypothetical protein E3E31_08180 [Thermococcus sp. M39]|uniref:hypothetical protein n=1 Tax=Thermococcus sp. M39 TaxID=1638262 RepID=UPI00143AAEB3|nr:hypothetical protein [Thermococcus sp. M39]NJE08498.1 hypothetical protein [Thermococcus sp. M39]
MITGERKRLLRFIFENFYMQGDIIELRAISRKFKHVKSSKAQSEYFLFPDELEKLVEKVNEWEKKIRNGEATWHGIYFGVHARKREVLEKQKERKKQRNTYSSVDEDVENFKVLFTDLDLFKENPPFKEVELAGKRVVLSKEWLLENRETAAEFKKEFALRLIDRIEEDLGFKPFLVVDSGFGIHLYFKFDQVLEDQKKYEEYFGFIRDYLVDLLARAFNDPAFAESVLDSKVKNPSRVSRLPFTINAKLAFKEDKEARRLEFLPENVLDVDVIYFEEDNYIRFDELEKLLQRKQRAKKSKKKAASAKIEVSRELHYKDVWEEYLKKHNIRELLGKVNLSNFFEIEDKETIEVIVKHLLKFIWEDKKNEFFLKMPVFFLARGVGIETIIRIFDRVLYIEREVWGLDEDPEDNRINAVCHTIETFFKCKLEEPQESGKKVGWKSFFFKIPDDFVEENKPLEERLRDLELWSDIVDKVIGYLRIIDDEEFEKIFGAGKKEVFGFTAEELEKLKREDFERSAELVKDFIIKTLREIALEIRMARKYAKKYIRTGKGEVRVHEGVERGEKKKGRPSKAELALAELSLLHTDQIVQEVAEVKSDYIEDAHKFVIKAILSLPKVDYETKKDILRKIQQVLDRYYKELQERAVVSVVKLKEVKIADSTNITLLIGLVNKISERLTLKIGRGDITAVPIKNDMKEAVGLFEVKDTDFIDNFASLNTKFVEAVNKKLYLSKDDIVEVLAELLNVDDLDVQLKYSNLLDIVVKNYYYHAYKGIKRWLAELWAKAETKEENELRELKAAFINLLDIYPKIRAGDKIRIPDALNVLERDEKKVLAIPARILKESVDKSASKLKKLKAFLKDNKLFIKDVATTETTSEGSKIVVYLFDYEKVREFYLRETGVDLEDLLEEPPAEIEENFLSRKLIEVAIQKIREELYKNGRISINELLAMLGYHEELVDKVVQELVDSGEVEVQDSTIFLKGVRE